MCVIVVVDQCPVGSERGWVGAELLLSPSQEGRKGGGARGIIHFRMD